MKWFGILALVSLPALTHAKLLCSGPEATLVLSQRSSRNADEFWYARLTQGSATTKLSGNRSVDDSGGFALEKYELIDGLHQLAVLEVSYLPVLDPTPHCTGRRICESDKNFSTEISATLTYLGLTYTFSCNETTL